MVMEHLRQDKLLFFDKSPEVYPLYAAFEEKLLALFPQTAIRVQKTQITFSQKHVFACVSLRRMGKGAGPRMTVTLGLPGPLASERVLALTEPYPGRWTVHIPVGDAAELDGELFAWIRQAVDFAQRK